MNDALFDEVRLEELAQAFHGRYLSDQRGRKPADDPAMQPWPALTEPLRESNRALARDVPRKLHLIGCDVSPCVEPDFAFTPAEVETLAAAEHERWNAERRAGGWTLGPRDAATKTTPYLVPYADLPDDVKGYDREAVRAIPAVLERVGFGIRRRA